MRLTINNRALKEVVTKSIYMIIFAVHADSLPRLSGVHPFRMKIKKAKVQQ
jgi:hypothetical protein